MTEMWEQLDPNDCGLFAHHLVNTEIIIYIGESDYTVCMGGAVLASFTELEDARVFAEAEETRSVEEEQ